MSRDLAPGSRLVIVRHGEAVCNAEDSLGGHDTCKGLTALGRRQVESLADRLSRTDELVGAVALYSSVLPRAVETAGILAPALGGLDVRQSCSLCERHVGRADGMSWTQYEAAFGRQVPGVDDDRPFAPGGESLSAFFDRAETALYDVMAAHQGRLVVVAGHGGIIGASCVRFLELPRNGAGFLSYIDNASMTEWCWTGRRWWLVRYNDAAHLDAGGWEQPGERHLRIAPPYWVAEDADPARSGGGAVPTLRQAQQARSGS